MNNRFLMAKASHRHLAKGRRRAFTLAEASLVLGLAMFAAVVAFALYAAGSNSINTRAQVSAAVDLVNNVKRMYSASANYTGVSAAVVSNASLVPAGFRTSGTAITHGFGSSVVIAPHTSPQQFQITYTAIPRKSCMDFATGIAGVVDELRIGTPGTSVKTVNTELDVAALATACAAAAGSNVIALVS